jgi:hypothetical protein
MAAPPRQREGVLSGRNSSDKWSVFLLSFHWLLGYNQVNEFSLFFRWVGLPDGEMEEKGAVPIGKTNW